MSTRAMLVALISIIFFGHVGWGSVAAELPEPISRRTSIQTPNPKLDERDEEIYQAKIRLANSLWLQHRVNDAWATLNEVPEAGRRVEWRLANQVFRGESLTLIGHRGEVTCLSFGPDGSRVVSGGSEGRVILWDAATGRQLWSASINAERPSQRCIVGVTISQDVQRVLCSTMTGHLIQLDIATGDVLRSFQNDDFVCERAQYCDGGAKIAMLVPSAGFSIVESESGRELHFAEFAQTEISPFAGSDSDNVTDMTARSDAKLLATAAGNMIRIWDVEKQQWGRTFSGSEAAITQVRFSPNGKRLLAANKSKQLLVWDFSNRRLVHKVQAPADWFMNFAMSADGSHIATSGSDGTLRVWDATTGELVKTFIGHSHPVHYLEFNPRGDKLASAGIDGTVRIWNIAGSSLLEAIPSDPDQPILAIRSDGKQAVSRLTDDSLRVWDLETGEQKQVLSELEAAVKLVRFSPDGAWIATGDSKGVLALWDAKTGTRQWQATDRSEAIAQIEFHPSGDQLATRVENGPVHLWNSADGALVAQLAGHGGPVRDMAFRPDGRSIAVGDWNGNIQIWDWPTLQKLGDQFTHPDSLHKLAYSPDSQLLATIAENTLSVWETATGRLRFTTGTDSDWLSQLMFVDGEPRIVTIDEANKLVVWNAEDGVELLSVDTGVKQQYALGLVSIDLLNDNSILRHRFESDWYRLPLSTEPYLAPLIGHQDLVFSTAIDPAGERVISGGKDSTVRVWDVKTGRLLHTLLGHLNRVVSVAISSDGSLGLSASAIDKVIVWDLATGQKLTEVPWTSGVQMKRVCCSPDGKTLYGRLGEDLVAWDPRSGKILKWIKYGSSYGDGLALSADGTRLATIGQTFSVHIYKTGDWSLQTSLPVPTIADALAFDRAGQRIATVSTATGDKQRLKVWDANTGLELMSFTDLTAKIDAVCFSPDGLYLASGDQAGQVILRHLETGNVSQFNAHGNWIAAVEFSPDGSLLASSSADGSVLLMDLGTGKMRHRFPGGELVMTGLDFSRDGTRLVAVGPQNTLKVWDVVTGAELHGSETLPESVRDVAFCGDGKQVVAVGQFVPEADDLFPEPRDFIPVVWDLESGQVTRCLQIPVLDALDFRASFNADGSMISIHDYSGKSLAWETISGAFIPDVQLPPPQRDENVSADGRFFVFPQNKDVGVHRLSPNGRDVPTKR